MAYRKYSAEHIEWLKSNIKGCPFRDLAVMFGKQFGTEIKLRALTTLTHRHGLHNGIDSRLAGGHPGCKATQFKKGSIPHNKGKKGVGGWEPTQFKKGNTPVNFRPVGSERVNVDGYIEVKVKDPNVWDLKHRIAWEQVHGEIPKGHAVIFGDGNKFNLDINNLILVSRAQLATLNKKGLIQM